MEDSEYNLQDLAQKAIEHAEKIKAGYVDIRIEDYSTSTIFRENKKFEDISFGNGFGLGVKVIHKGKLGFYSTTKADPIFAVEQALKLAKVNPSREKIKLKKSKTVKSKIDDTGKNQINHDIDSHAQFLKDVEKTAQISPVLKSIQVILGNGVKNYIFANTEDTEILQKVGRTNLYVILVAKEKGELERCVFRLGAKDYTVFRNYEEKLKEKAKLVIDLLKAKKPLAGKFNVVLDPESTGVFAHEALGHAAEADLVLSNQSLLKGKSGKKIASSCVSISDDPTIPEDKWGSYKYDDEGVLGRKTNIISKGILKSFLHSRETAAKMNTGLTGNARAQNYMYVPIVRMSNTSFEAGDFSFNELIKQVKNGYYLVGFKGGQVGPLEGTFSFASDHCYRIQNGKIKELLKGCTFSGKILDTLKNVTAVQKGKRKFTIGFCGKGGQKVPVSDGGTHISIKDLHIGGEE